MTTEQEGKPDKESQLSQIKSVYNQYRDYLSGKRDNKRLLDLVEEDAVKQCFKLGLVPSSTSERNKAFKLPSGTVYTATEEELEFMSDNFGAEEVEAPKKKVKQETPLHDPNGPFFSPRKNYNFLTKKKIIINK